MKNHFRRRNHALRMAALYGRYSHKSAQENRCAVQNHQDERNSNGKDGKHTYKARRKDKKIGRYLDKLYEQVNPGQLCRIPPAGKMINAGCDCTQQGKQPEKAEKEKAQIDIILKKIFHPGRMQERTQQKSDCIWKKDDKRIWQELSHKNHLFSVGSGCGVYCRTCPFPRITYLYEVSSLSPMGPLA